MLYLFSVNFFGLLVCHEICFLSYYFVFKFVYILYYYFLLFLVIFLTFSEDTIFG